jgi:hypothetical protein
MQEHATALPVDQWFRAHELQPGRLDLGDGGFQVVHAEAHMMNTWAAAVEKPLQGRVRAERLNDLDGRVAGVELAGPDAILKEVLLAYREAGISIPYSRREVRLIATPETPQNPVESRS